MILLSIGTFLVALAFAGFAVCLAVLLNRVTKMLIHAGNAVEDIERHAEKLVTRVECTLVEADQTLSDIAVKLNAADPLFQSAGHISSSVEHVSTLLNEEAAKLADPAYLKQVDSYLRAAEWSEVASRLYRKWKVAEAN